MSTEPSESTPTHVLIAEDRAKLLGSCALICFSLAFLCWLPGMFVPQLISVCFPLLIFLAFIFSLFAFVLKTSVGAGILLAIALGFIAVFFLIAAIFSGLPTC